MPELSLTKGSRIVGLQTFQKVRAIPLEIRQVELEYLDARDWYVNQLAILAQLQEELAQTRGDDAQRTRELQGKIHAINCSLKDVRGRVKAAAERSYAEAFLLAARLMLPKEIKGAIEAEADRLLGRPAQELARKD